jgi:hypothetical protein
MTNEAPTVARKTRKQEVVQEALFDLSPSWKDYWWGMPSFEMGDARPIQRITVNFYSWDDVIEFGRRLDVRVTRATDSLAFPPEHVEKPSDWGYEDEP